MSSKKFPRAEAEILALGQKITAGFKAHSDIYPNPPLDIPDFDAAMEAYVVARDAAVGARGEAKRAIDAKDEALAAFVGNIKSALRYAENTVDYDDGELELIGWSGRRPPTPLAPPGQPLSLEAPDRGDGWISLEWEEPEGGGKVAAYKVQRRENDATEWQDVGMAVETATRLEGQEGGKWFVFRVIAVNKAGEGEPSNSVMATL
uniref:Fibronectin type III domain-containing protein n=1 Tax=Candidatus Kentrum eta TaxID=2126337 RepID=A0A450UCA3_9GAMM|nr:MAG: Fibronectin type III domain-containing protein [Candidatus Kentron sp. H]VFJ89976.1 MAG: Fibronectin type III domain-containing protein [Candidatus Kentron sp. H]VFJ96353.1 MAG: Fibronectin type III domain-containing protein [Candidatus Kentron sp. H]